MVWLMTLAVEELMRGDVFCDYPVCALMESHVCVCESVREREQRMEGKLGKGREGGWMRRKGCDWQMRTQSGGKVTEGTSSDATQVCVVCV